MSLRNRTGAVVAVIAVGALLIAGCSSTSSTSSAGGSGSLRGGTLTILNQGDFEHIDPGRNYVGGTLDFYRFFVRTLVQYKTLNGKTTLVPDVAADLGTTPDNGKTWTFKLRTNLKYEDGSKVTCADLKYGTMRTYNDDILDGGTTYAKDNLANPTNYKGPYTDPTGDLPSVVCSPSGDAITYNLKQAVPYFPYFTTFGSFSPVPKAKDTKQNYDLHPISTGPYMIESYNRGKNLTLVRNKYWDPNTDPLRHDYLDKIVVKFGYDQGALEQMFIADSGEASTALSLDTNIVNNISAVAGNAKYASRYLSFPSPYARYLAINQETVTDVNVRKAIQCAIDLVTILNAAGGTHAGVYANSLLPSSVINYRNYPVCGRDVTTSPQAQVAAAKGFLAKAKTKKMSLVLAYRDKGVEPARASAAQAALEAVGFKVTMSKLPRAGYYTAIGKRGPGVVQPDVIQTSWAFDWPAPSGIVTALLDGATMIASDSHSNYSRQNDPAIQALFTAAYANPATLEKSLADIEQKLVQDSASVVPTYIETSNVLYGSKVGGVQADGGYGTTSPINAYIKK